MSQEPDRTCKRCSVARVNALMKAYRQAHEQSQRQAQTGLSKLCAICRQHHFEKAEKLLAPGLEEKDLRALCWNVSSFLKDHEVELALGIKL